MSKVDRKNAVPSTLTTIPLADPHAGPAEPSIGHLIKDATTQVSTLVRAEVELARAEITRDVKKGLTGSIYFIAALVVLFYSTFFFFFFLAELLDTWLWRWVDGKPIVNRWRDHTQLPARSELSDRISKELQKRGFKFVGSTIIYAYLQAVGVVNDHLLGCFCHAQLSGRRGKAPTP